MIRGVVRLALRDVLCTPEYPDDVLVHMELKGFDIGEVKGALWSMLDSGELDPDRYGKLEFY